MSAVRLQWILVAVVTVALAGCGGGLIPVQGKVTLEDGTTPLTAGDIEFVPLNPEGERVTSIAQIQEDGTFTLETYGPGDGCAPGKYKVMIVGATPEIKDSYESEEETTLQVEVKPGAEYNLKVTKK